MYSKSLIAFLFVCVAAVAQAAPQPSKRIKTVDDPFNILPTGVRDFRTGSRKSRSITIVDAFSKTATVKQVSEETVYAVEESSSGYGRLTTTGLTVQRGTSGVLRYNISVTAIEARTLATKDSTFESTLSTAEKETYQRIKSEYNSNLRVPWCWWLGINLDRSSSRETMDYARSRQENYNQKATVAKEILESTDESNLRISGELTATGTSFIPTTVFAFIKTATITFEDGSTKTVVSNSADDVVAANNNGQTVPSDGYVDIVPF